MGPFTPRASEQLVYPLFCKSLCRGRGGTNRRFDGDAGDFRTFRITSMTSTSLPLSPWAAGPEVKTAGVSLVSSTGSRLTTTPLRSRQRKGRSPTTLARGRRSVDAVTRDSRACAGFAGAGGPMQELSDVAERISRDFPRRVPRRAVVVPSRRLLGPAARPWGGIALRKVGQFGQNGKSDGGLPTARLSAARFPATPLPTARFQRSPS